GGGDFVDRGDMPPDEDSDPRLPGRRPARYWRRFHPAPRRPHPRGVGCSAVVARRCQGGVPLTDTVDLPINKVVVRGGDILTRTEAGHVGTPNLFFNPEKWSQAYEQQKQCGFVFTPKEYVPLV